MVNHINIEMLNGDKILSNRILLGQIMVLKGQELKVDLIMFEMPDFYIILGMDFLNRYEAEIQCKKKKVKFSLDNGDKFSFGIGQLRSLMIINVKDHKMLNQRYIGYLAQVINRYDFETTSNVGCISWSISF